MDAGDFDPSVASQARLDVLAARRVIGWGVGYILIFTLTIIAIVSGAGLWPHLTGG